MTFTPANIFFNDGDSKLIVNTLLYVSNNFNTPLPGTGYWITNNAYANDMRQYWGGWWVAYFYNDHTGKAGFGSFFDIPTESEILSTVSSPKFVWEGNLQSNEEPIGTINLINLSTYESQVQPNGTLNVTTENDTTTFFYNNIPVKYFLPLNNGLNGTVTDMAYYNSKLYIIGTFTKSGLLPLNGIALWDGTSFQNLGGGINGIPNSIAIDSNGIVYVAGKFTSVGGITMPNIAKWDGISWSMPGNDIGSDEISFVGLDSENNVYCITKNYAYPSVYKLKQDNTWQILGYLGDYYGQYVSTAYIDKSNNLLYVGGQFNTINPFDPNAYDPNAVIQNVGNIALLDLNTFIWSNLATGVKNGSIKKIYMNNSKDLYVSGDFNNIDSIYYTVPGFAKWNGNRWSAVFK